MHLLERLSSFILPENLVVFGMRKYPAKLCQVSPASCVQALSPSLEIRKTCCVRPWHSHINALSSRLLSTLPSLLLHFLPQHTKVAMLNSDTDPQPIQGSCRTQSPNQGFTFVCTECFGDSEHNQGEVYAHISLVFSAASELCYTRIMICLSVLSIRNA